MILTDTHAHLYLNAFDDDRDTMIAGAFRTGVTRILIPNIDQDSLVPMHHLCNQYPGHLFPMAGLHPTSVRDDFETVLSTIGAGLPGNYVGIGECGIDLYWDRTFLAHQKMAFRTQLEWSFKHGLPVAIHIRSSFDEVFEVLKSTGHATFKGVFHCFSGNKTQAAQAIEMGFLLGIGGVVTFKNSGLPKIIKDIDPSKIVLETDAPFLAPMPYRGKRNESAYLRIVAEKVAALWGMPIHEAASITTANAVSLFKKINHHE
ncbi:MAG: TatD family hydrolase [Bacteroidales bacterium]|nr:TatD family hydrolase [Bacteroidales bacterium]